MYPPDGTGLDDGPRPGRRLGRWSVEARLGAGGVATVWRATDDDGRVAALKVVPIGAVDAEDLARLEREHAALARFAHPNIVRVLDQGRGAGHAWIALEYVDGEDLEAVLRRWRDDPPADRFAQAEAIFRQLAEALDHIHQLGFVHRDIKPANVLRGRDGHVRLVDFGVVSAPEVSRITLVGRLVGTIAYMAPELIAEEPVDGRADLYGLGALLYALLARRRPIEADSVAGYLARHLTTTPVPPHEVDPDVPRHLERVALRLLEKEPARRYATGRAAVEALTSTEPGGTPLHGRVDVIRLWRDRLDASRRGAGPLILVDGPPGSGRSALLRHWIEVAREEGRDIADARDPAAATAEIVVADDADRLPPEARRRLDAAIADQRLVAIVRQAGRTVAPDVQVVRLEPLGRRAIANVLRDRGCSTAVAAALARRLDQSGDGWPGTVLALLVALVREGWLEDHGGALTAARPLEDFRSGDLPVPEADRLALVERLGALDEDERELVELLALLARPAGASLLARATSGPARAPAAIDRLIRDGWIRAEAGEDDLTLRLAPTSASTVVRDATSPEDRRARHLTLAQVLGRRRRRGSTEAAVHLAAAGRADEAMPMFATTARQELEAGEAATALRSIEEAESALAAAGDALEDADRWRRLLASLRGTALFALGRWPEALPALEGALELARSTGEPRAIARAASSLGRALYRLGRLDAAAASLSEALQLGDPATVEVDEARRSLADILLQRGQFDEASKLLHEALEGAIARGSRDEEARARRGLGHLHGLQGRYSDAAIAFEQADDLLANGGDPRVRAGVLVRTLELDTAAGRYALALHRAEVLLDLLQTHGLGGSLPDALAACAALRCAVGQDDEAASLARRALLLARAHPVAAWEAVIEAVRVLAMLRRVEQDDVGLVLAAADARSEVRRPAALAHALAARLLATRDPAAAVDHLALADAEPPARWGLAELVRAVDAAWAEVELGHVASALARIARAELHLPSDRADGARLELARLRVAAGEVVPPELVRSLVVAVAGPLPGRLRQAFLRRPDLAGLLGDEPSLDGID